jgi:hypothetical protein
MNGQPDHSMAPREGAPNLFSAIPSAREVVHLVSRAGEKVPVQEQVLKDSSDFFKASVESGMQESGKYYESYLVWDS